MERMNGYEGRDARDVLADMKKVIAEGESSVSSIQCERYQGFSECGP